MSKGKHGNKEVKKPKQVRTPLPPPGTLPPVVAVKPGGPARKS